MRVVAVTRATPGEPAVQLAGEDGQPVAEANGFLRLAVREYSPNTVRAYAHDLQKLFAFSAESGYRRASSRPPGREAGFTGAGCVWRDGIAAIVAALR